MATGVTVSRRVTTPTRSKQVLTATPENEMQVEKYSKRGAAGDPRKVDMFFLMQKYGAKRDFLKEGSEQGSDAEEKPKKLGFIVKFSLKSAYEALERQEFEASVPQLTPVKAVRRRAIILKKRAPLGSIPEGGLMSVVPAGQESSVFTESSPSPSASASRATTAKSRKMEAMEQMKAQNQKKLLWKSFAKKAMGSSEAAVEGQTKPSPNANLLAFRKVVAEKLAEKRELEAIETAEDDEIFVDDLSRPTSRSQTRMRFISNTLPDVADEKSATKQKGAKATKNVGKIQSNKQKKGNTDKKLLKKDGNKVEKKGKSLTRSQSKEKTSTKVRKQSEDSKQNREGGERCSSGSRKRGKKIEAEVYEPFRSKLYQTMMMQTLGGKRPENDFEDSSSMDTMTRFLKTSDSTADEDEIVTVSEMVPSRLSVNDSGSRTMKPRNPKPKGASQKDSVKGGTKTVPPNAKEAFASSERELRERGRKTLGANDEPFPERRRKATKYLYHMCNCRQIAKPETLSRLYKKKPNVAGVIEIYGCPPEGEKGDSPIVCPFCTVFPRQRVNAWLEDLADEEAERDEEQDETAPHNRMNIP